MKYRCIMAILAALVVASSIPTRATSVSTLMGDFLSDMGEDSTNSRFTHAQRLRFLNRATQAVSVIIGGVEVTQRIPLVNDKAEYALSTGYWGLETVMLRKDNNYVQLERVLPRDLGTNKYSVLVDPNLIREPKSEAATIVERYAIFDDTLLIYPTLPSFGYDTLYVKCFTAPASLDSLSQPTELKFWTDDYVVEAAGFYANRRDLTLADEVSWWQSFMQRIVTAQSLYIRTQPVQTGVAPQ